MNKARTMVYASVQTRHFDFDGIFTSEVGARAAFKDAWERHVKETGATMTWEELDEDLDIRELEIGLVYRDTHPIR